MVLLPVVAAKNMLQAAPEIGEYSARFRDGHPPGEATARNVEGNMEVIGVNPEVWYI
jgi:hypothetical protein